MKPSLLLLIPALLVTLFSSCKKDEGSHNTVTPGGYRSLDDAMASTAPKPKSTSISVSSGDTLFAYGGTKFIIPPNVFETLNGTKVTGSVNITIQDWLFKGDMIFGRVLPINYANVLQSGGEAFIQATTKEGQVLRIRKDTFVTVMFPQFGSGLSGLSGWTGRTMIGSANTVNWLPSTPGALVPTDIADTISVRADTLHYIQVANQMPSSSFYNFVVKVNSPVVLEQSMTFAMYDNIKAVFPLPNVIDGKVTAVQVPGGPMHIAVMGINKGQFFGGIVAVPDPRSDSTYSVKMVAQEPPTLRQQMNTL